MSEEKNPFLFYLWQEREWIRVHMGFPRTKLDELVRAGLVRARKVGEGPHCRLLFSVYDLNDWLNLQAVRYIPAADKEEDKEDGKVRA